MLGLKSNTQQNWVTLVENNLATFLSDHAFAEQKAAAGAVSIIIIFPEETELVKVLTQISLEEMEHFKLVHQLIIKKGFILGRDKKSNYAIHLQQFFPKGGSRSEQLVHRLLVSALIEARSCERFKVLSQHLKDKELTSFYHSLLVSEAGHHTTFLNFARKYMDKQLVDEKWNDLLDYEAQYMINQGVKPLVHG